MPEKTKSELRKAIVDSPISDVFEGTSSFRVGKRMGRKNTGADDREGS